MSADSKIASGRLFARVTHLIEVEVPEGTYESIEDAANDSEFHEFMGNTLRLVECEGWDVVTDPDEIEQLRQDRPSWTMTVAYDRRPAPTCTSESEATDD